MRPCHPPDPPVPSISCCVLNHHNLFYQMQNALAFNQDTWCHLALCLWLLPFHWELLNGKLLSSFAYIALARKGKPDTNTLAYFAPVSATKKKKSFTTLIPRCCLTLSTFCRWKKRRSTETFALGGAAPSRSEKRTRDPFFISVVTIYRWDPHAAST